MTPTVNPPTETLRRSMAWSGLAAAITGAVSTMMSSTPVALGDRRADPASAITDAFEGLATTLKAASALGLISVALLIVFVTVLRQRLEAEHPAGSVVPGLAWAGGIMAGAALSVAFIVSAIAGTLLDEGYRDTTLETFGAFADNLAFAAWVPLGLTMAAVATSGLRHNAVPRWLGVLSTATTVVLLIALGLGLPFASWILACGWLLAASVATARLTR